MRRILLVSLSSLLMSCSVFSPVKMTPPTTYTLNMLPAQSEHVTKRPISILVNYPQAGVIYNTTQMAYSIKPFEVAYYAKSQWADTPSHLLQPLMAQTLQNTHAFRHVISPGMLGRYDYVLNTQLVSMDHVFTQQPSVMRIRLKAQLVNVSTNQIVASKEFAMDEAAEPTPYGGVIAANQAISTLLSQLAQFVIKAT